MQREQETTATEHIGEAQLTDRQPAVAFENLRKSYGDFEVLKGLSGEIRQGEVVSIIGPSGCGKSTFLRCMNRLETISGGRLEVIGIDISDASLGARNLRRLRSQVGMVFQGFNLFPHLSVRENLTIAPRQVLGRSLAEANELATTYLEKVGLANKADAYPDQLSGGQKQRVAIARSLCMKPLVMLFDEPTSALDPELVGEVLGVMKQLASEGMTMAIVTHEIKFARDVADKVIFLSSGVIEEMGAASEVLTHPSSDRLRAFLSRLA